MTNFPVAPTYVYQTPMGKYANEINEQLKMNIEKQKELVKLDMHEVYEMSAMSKIELGDA